MIFVTIGTQLPFHRLVAAMDQIARELDEHIVAQIGADSDAYPNLELRHRLPPDHFEALVAEARIIVAHAGIGTILAARRHCKPLILMARRHDLGEHRNDHQVATLAALAGQPGIYPAAEPEDLARLLRRRDLVPAESTPGPDLDKLILFLTTWITSDS